jgi:hypothetical protein
MKFIHDVAEIFDADVLKPMGYEIVINGALLNNVVYSYYYDKERHKDFHGSNEPNDEKKAAFLCRWIAKIRPFSIVPIEGSEIKTPAQLSLYFAMTCLANGYFCLHLFQALTKKKASQHFDSTLVYEMHYGEPTRNMLMALFERT